MDSELQYGAYIRHGERALCRRSGEMIGRHLSGTDPVRMDSLCPGEGAGEAANPAYLSSSSGFTPENVARLWRSMQNEDTA